MSRAGGVEGHCARADFSQGKSVLTIVPLFGRSGTGCTPSTITLPPCTPPTSTGSAWPRTRDMTATGRPSTSTPAEPAGWSATPPRSTSAGPAGMVGTSVLLDFLSVFLAHRHRPPGRVDCRRPRRAACRQRPWRTAALTDLLPGPLVSRSLPEIPGIYPPIRLGDKWYVDGGVHPVPTEFVRPLGADYVIAVDLAGAVTRGAVAFAQPPPAGRAAPLREPDARAADQTSHAGADLILRPRDTTGPAPGVRDYAKAREWRRREWRRLGREAVDAAWPDLCRRLPWLVPRHRGSIL